MRSQLCQPPPRWCRNRSGEGKAEETGASGRQRREFPVLNLGSSEEQTPGFFCFVCHQWNETVHVSPEKTGNFPKTKGVLAAAWEYSLKSPF